MDKNEVVKLLGELRKHCSLEKVADEIEKSWGTVYLWSKGIRVCDKGDFELMKTLLKKLEPIKNKCMEREGRNGQTI